MKYKHMFWVWIVLVLLSSVGVADAAPKKVRKLTPAQVAAIQRRSAELARRDATIRAWQSREAAKVRKAQRALEPPPPETPNLVNTATQLATKPDDAQGDPGFATISATALAFTICLVFGLSYNRRNAGKSDTAIFAPEPDFVPDPADIYHYDSADRGLGLSRITLTPSAFINQVAQAAPVEQIPQVEQVTSKPQRRRATTPKAPPKRVAKAPVAPKRRVATPGVRTPRPRVAKPVLVVLPEPVPVAAVAIQPTLEPVTMPAPALVPEVPPEIAVWENPVMVPEALPEPEAQTEIVTWDESATKPNIVWVDSASDDIESFPLETTPDADSDLPVQEERVPDEFMRTLPILVDDDGSDPWHFGNEPSASVSATTH